MCEGNAEIQRRKCVYVELDTTEIATANKAS